MITILHVHKYYIFMQSIEIILPYQLFKMTPSIFQLNKQNKVCLSASLYCAG